MVQRVCRLLILIDFAKVPFIRVVSILFSSLLRASISARKSDTRNYTLRVSKILLFAKECNSVNPVSDS